MCERQHPWLELSRLPWGTLFGQANYSPTRLRERGDFAGACRWWGMPCGRSVSVLSLLFPLLIEPPHRGSRTGFRTHRDPNERDITRGLDVLDTDTCLWKRELLPPLATRPACCGMHCQAVEHDTLTSSAQPGRGRAQATVKPDLASSSLTTASRNRGEPHGSPDELTKPTNLLE